MRCLPLHILAPVATSVNRLLAALTGDVRGLRIGLPRECFGEGLDSAVRACVLAAADVLRDRGAELVPLSFPMMEYVIPTYYIIACAEASSNLSRFDGVKYGWRAEGYGDLRELYQQTRTEGFGPEVRWRILLGTFVLSSGYYDAYYLKALRAKGMIKRAFDEAFCQCDVMLTPTAPAAAPGGEDASGVAGSLPAGVQSPDGGLTPLAPKNPHRRGAAALHGGQHGVRRVIAPQLLAQDGQSLRQSLGHKRRQTAPKIAPGDTGAIAGDDPSGAYGGALLKEILHPLGRGQIAASSGGVGGLL